MNIFRSEDKYMGLFRNSEDDCESCGGSGSVNQTSGNIALNSGSTGDDIYNNTPVANRNGTIIKVPCTRCGGSGKKSS